MILKKKLRLTQASSRNFPDNAIKNVNGLAYMFSDFADQFASFLVMPIKLVFCLWKLYTILGKSFIIGIVIFQTLLYVDKIINDSLHDKHHEKNKVQRELDDFQNEVFDNVKTIKFYGWDIKFLDKIIEYKTAVH